MMTIKYVCSACGKTTEIVLRNHVGEYPKVQCNVCNFPMIIKTISGEE